MGLIKTMKSFLFGVYCRFVRFFNVSWLPPLVIWEPTLACNYRCKFCGFYGLGGALPELKKELNTKQALEVVDQLNCFARHVGITGGEPLLRKDLLDILGALTVSYSITTNGYLITEEIIGDERFRPSEVRISLHGLEETHDCLVGVNGAFKKVCENIKLLVGARIPVLVNCVITDSNIDELEKLKECVVGLGAEIRFQHLEFTTIEQQKKHKCFMKSTFGEALPVKYGTTCLSCESVEKLKRFKNECYEPSEINSSNMMDNYYGDFGWTNSEYCYQVWGTARVNPYGDVYPCVDYIYGNIIKNNFGEVWCGERAVKFRKILKKCKLFPACSRCCKL